LDEGKRIILLSKNDQKDNEKDNESEDKDREGGVFAHFKVLQNRYSSSRILQCCKMFLPQGYIMPTSTSPDTFFRIARYHEGTWLFLVFSEENSTVEFTFTSTTPTNLLFSYSIVGEELYVYYRPQPEVGIPIGKSGNKYVENYVLPFHVGNVGYLRSGFNFFFGEETIVYPAYVYLSDGTRQEYNPSSFEFEEGIVTPASSEYPFTNPTDAGRRLYANEGICGERFGYCDGSQLCVIDYSGNNNYVCSDTLFPSGLAGISGEQGEIGLQGSQGIEGFKGEDGEPGERGESNTEWSLTYLGFFAILIVFVIVGLFYFLPVFRYPEFYVFRESK
jgi:hypothetical protein